MQCDRHHRPQNKQLSLSFFLSLSLVTLNHLAAWYTRPAPGPAPAAGACATVSIQSWQVQRPFRSHCSSSRNGLVCQPFLWIYKFVAVSKVDITLESCHGIDHVSVVSTTRAKTEQSEVGIDRKKKGNQDVCQFVGLSSFLSFTDMTSVCM